MQRLYLTLYQGFHWTPQRLIQFPPKMVENWLSYELVAW